MPPEIQLVGEQTLINNTEKKIKYEPAFLGSGAHLPRPEHEQSTTSMDATALATAIE
jgi:hypothetical protein